MGRLAQRVVARFVNSRDTPSRDYKMVIIGQDNTSDWIQLPNGTRLMLGAISVLQFVSKLARNSTQAKLALDEFLKDGQAMLSVSMSAMEKLFTPRKTRW